jgi:plastocyanin
MYKANTRWRWWILRSREHEVTELKSIRTQKRRKSMRRGVSIAGLAAALVLGMGVFGPGHKSSVASAQEKASTMEVKIDNFSFGPVTLTVTTGTTVTWTNRDDIPHTVVSTDDPKTFKSKVLDTDEKFSFTFSKAGTYPYFCSIHPKMTGKVIVQ